MPFISGYLIEAADPGFGNRPGGPEIDNSLPGGLPPGIDNTLPIPEPPPGIWPPPGPGRPIVPIGPDNTLPVQPGTIWPSPGRPPRPGHDLPGSGGHPDHELPGGGYPDNTLPSQTYWMLCFCPSLGWRFVSVDPSLRPGMPLPPHAEPR